MEHKVKLAPIKVPNFVLVEESSSRNPKHCNSTMYTSISITELSEETLSGLCDEFRKNVFKKAGKKDPKENVNIGEHI